MAGQFVKSTLAVGFEPASNPGKQLLFGPAVVALTQSLTTQPIINATATEGQHLLVVIQGIASGASGTITLTGKKTDGVTAVNETTTAISLANADSNGNYYYCTKAVFGSVNASGVTASSVSGALANAVMTIYGICSAKWLVPCEFKPVVDYDVFSPADNRGLYDEDVRMAQLIKKVTWEAGGALYPETSEWFLLSSVANATTPSTPASLPGSPVSLLAATAFSGIGGTGVSLTTQPSYPGMQFVLTVGNANAVAGTVSLAGTDRYGNVISEVISIPGTTGTFYSQNVYNTLNALGVTSSGFTSTATLAIAGVFVYVKNYLPTDSLISLAGEHFDGVGSSVVPWMVPEEWSLEYDVQKEMKFSLKGNAQDYIAVGDLTPTNMNTNQFGPYAQPTDLPVVGWPGAFYLDALGGTPGTTPAVNVFDIITLKVVGTTGLVPYWTAVQGQPYNRVGRKRRKTTWEAEIDFINMAAFKQYEAFTKGIFTAQFRGGNWIGNNAGSLVYKQLQIVLPSRRVKFSREGNEERVVGKVSGTCEYEPSLGYSFSIAMTNQNNPNYAL